MRSIRKYSVWVVLLAVVVTLSSLAIWVTPTYRVETGSMRPTMPIGSLVVTHPESSYHRGDIITFRADNSEIVTHRLVKITKDGEYVTKGDDNPTRDYWQDPVTKSDIIGKVLFVIPFTAASFWLSARGIGIMVCLAIIALAIFWKIEDEEETTPVSLVKTPGNSPA